MDKHLARKSLDRCFSTLSPLHTIKPPSKGWIRAIRDAIGLTSAQLAKRMHVSQPRITALEHAEMNGSVTLATLEKAASALDCTLVYTFIPHKTLDNIVFDRARMKANKMIERIHNTMTLESQNLDQQSLLEERDALITRLMHGNLRGLWEDTLD